MANAHVEVRMNPEAMAKFHEAIEKGITDIFVYDVWPAAVEKSPVSKGKQQGGTYAGGGTNRRSITVEVNSFGEKSTVRGGDGADKDGVPFSQNAGVAISSPTGISVAVYTQSGYGGYLETGTRYMPARPYIYPAIEEALPKIAALINAYTEKAGT
jgi:hypothetical protein